MANLRLASALPAPDSDFVLRIARRAFIGPSLAGATRRRHSREYPLPSKPLRMLDGSSRVPVLWSTSSVSGEIVQAPLSHALDLVQPTLSVCAADTSLDAAARGRGKLLAAPRTPRNLRALARLPLSWAADRRLIRQGVAQRASIVHVTISSPWDVLYLGAAKGVGAPILLTLHDGERHLGEESRLLAALEDRIIALADHVVCLSRPVYETLERSGRVRKSLHLLEDALLMRSDEPLPPRPNPSGSAPDDPLRLLFLGRIHAYKGLGVALDTMDLLQAKNIRAILSIAGRGDLTSYADRLARLGPWVEVDNGWLSRDDIARHLRISDVMFMPYREASQSGVAIDALWAALPSVATRVGALPQQLTEDENALFAPADDARALADAIARLASDRDLYARLSTGAYRAYQAKSPRAVAQRWLDLYAQILKD